jgi:hypothetical protein
MADDGAERKPNRAGPLSCCCPVFRPLVCVSQDRRWFGSSQNKRLEASISILLFLAILSIGTFSWACSRDRLPSLEGSLRGDMSCALPQQRNVPTSYAEIQAK